MQVRPFRRHVWQAPISFVLISFVLSCAALAETDTLTSNPVYQKNCAKCHGKTAEGRHFGGPSLISEGAAAMSADQLSNVINNGKGRMPKYAAKLKPEEIDALVKQIQALNTHK